MNSRKFTEATCSSTQRQYLDNKLYSTPLVSKRSDLVAVVAPTGIKGLRLVTIQLPEKFSPIGLGDQPNFALWGFSEVPALAH
jgi:hypothetical protein